MLVDLGADRIAARARSRARTRVGDTTAAATATAGANFTSTTGITAVTTTGIAIILTPPSHQCSMLEGLLEISYRIKNHGEVLRHSINQLVICVNRIFSG